MRLSQDQIQKAAYVFLSLENASPGVMEPIFADLAPDHAKSILSAMSEMGRVRSDLSQPAIKEFYDIAFDLDAVYGGAEVTTRIAKSVFGEDQSASIIKNSKDRFRFLETTPAEDIVQFLETETPQAKVLLFHYLSPKKASEILMLLGDDAVVYAMGKGVNVPSPDLLNEVEVVWSAYFDRLREERSFSDEANIHKIAKMMEFLPKAKRDNVLKGYAKRSQKLANRLSQLVFAFDDLLSLPDDTLKLILDEPFDYRHIAHLRLQLQADWVEKINHCMSSQMLAKVDIESSGLSFNQQRTDEAKRYFIETARRLEREGVVTLKCQN